MFAQSIQLFGHFGGLQGLRVLPSVFFDGWTIRPILGVHKACFATKPTVTPLTPEDHESDQKYGS